MIEIRAMTSSDISDVYRIETVSFRTPWSYKSLAAELSNSLAHYLVACMEGVDVVDILLHVGLGTFRPVSAENVEDHIMHSEHFEVTADAADRINKARKNGGRIVCVSERRPSEHLKPLRTATESYTPAPGKQTSLSRRAILSRRLIASLRIFTCPNRLF